MNKQDHEVERKKLKYFHSHQSVIMNLTSAFNPSFRLQREHTWARHRSSGPIPWSVLGFEPSSGYKTNHLAPQRTKVREANIIAMREIFKWDFYSIIKEMINWRIFVHQWRRKRSKCLRRNATLITTASLGSIRLQLSSQTWYRDTTLNLYWAWNPHLYQCLIQ